MQASDEMTRAGNAGRANRSRTPKRRLTPFALAALFLLFVTPPALADPVQYDFSSGIVTLFATVGGDVLVDPVTVPLDGIQVTVDTMIDQVVSMELTAPGPIALTLNDVYSGYDEVVIESLAVSGGPGTLVELAAGPPAEYFYLVNPLTLDLELSADGPAPSEGPIDNALVSTDTVGTGNLFIDTDQNELTLTGISLGSFDLGTGETPIVIKGDFVFTGDSEVPIPEPSAALAFALGLVTFASARTRRGRRM